MDGGGTETETTTETTEQREGTISGNNRAGSRFNSLSFLDENLDEEGEQFVGPFKLGSSLSNDNQGETTLVDSKADFQEVGNKVKGVINKEVVGQQSKGLGQSKKNKGKVAGLKVNRVGVHMEGLGLNMVDNGFLVGVNRKQKEGSVGLKILDPAHHTVASFNENSDPNSLLGFKNLISPDSFPDVLKSKLLNTNTNNGELYGDSSRTSKGDSISVGSAFTGLIQELDGIDEAVNFPPGNVDVASIGGKKVSAQHDIILNADKGEDDGVEGMDDR